MHTREEIGEAYTKLIWAQGLINFVLRAGFNIREDTDKGKLEGSLLSIFSILKDYLEPAEPILYALDSGQKELTE